jgi:crotonobetaine/carnitine-CoA ligase
MSIAVPRSIRELLEQQAATFGDKTALVVADEPVSYQGLDHRTNWISNQFANLGLRPGDAVGTFCDNCLEAVEFWLAAGKGGFVYVTINAHYRGEFLRHPLALSEVKVLLVERELVPMVVNVIAGLPQLRYLVVREDGTDASMEVPPGITVISSAEFCRGASYSMDKPYDADPSQTNMILFSAGTTGVSKGVVASHNYLLTSSAICFRLKGGTSEDVQFTPLPLFHGNAMMQSVLGPLIYGARGCIERKFSVTRFWDRARHHEATLATVLGSIVRMLWSQPERPDDGDNAVRILLGAPMPADIHRSFERRFGLKYLSTYGLAEAWPVLISTVDDPPDPGWAGRRRDDFDVVVLDDHDRIVPDGTVGEIAVRPLAPSIMSEGYFRNPEATVESTRNLWFHTGDYGVRREDGWFAFVDRKKDTIRRRGENISSWELEQSASSYSQVAELAAFAVPSDVGEDEIMVNVVVQGDDEFDMVAFMDHCVMNMPYFAVPRYVEVVDDIPRSAMNKALKTVLRERGVTDRTWDREAAGYVVERRKVAPAAGEST